jgi:A118 family predicted phage portal protein
MTTTRTATVAAVAERIGAPSAAKDWQTHIELWNELYTCKGHEATLRLATGNQQVRIRTLAMAKRIAEDWAAMLWTENTAIEAGESDSPEGQFMADVFGGRFNRRYGGFIERVMSAGTGVSELLVDGMTFIGDRMVTSPDARLRTNFVPAECVIPLKWSEGVITEVALVSFSSEYVDIREHRIEGNGHLIRNTRYKVDSRGQVEVGEDVLPEGLLPELYYEGPPMFSGLMPSIENNIDPLSPFGLSVFANAVDHLYGTDIAFHNLINDLDLGQKMLLLPETLVRHDDDGKAISPITDKKSLVVVLANATGEDQKPQEYNPDLRVADNTVAIGTTLSLLGSAVGMGSGRYVYDTRSGAVTATQVIAENDDLYRNRAKHLVAVSENATAMARAALWAGRNVMGLPVDPEAEVVVRSDDSVIEDDASRKQRGQAAVAAGVMSLERYLTDFEDMTEEDAKAEVARIRPAVPSMFGTV